jgi:hypothetical protein
MTMAVSTGDGVIYGNESAGGGVNVMVQLEGMQRTRLVPEFQWCFVRLRGMVYYMEMRAWRLNAMSQLEGLQSTQLVDLQWCFVRLSLPGIVFQLLAQAASPPSRLFLGVYVVVASFAKLKTHQPQKCPFEAAVISCCVLIALIFEQYWSH